MKESEYINYADALKITQSDTFYGTLLQTQIRHAIFSRSCKHEAEQNDIADILQCNNISSAIQKTFNAHNSTILLANLVTSMEMIEAYSNKELFIRDTAGVTIPYNDTLLTKEEAGTLQTLVMTYNVPINNHRYIPKAGKLDHLNRQHIATALIHCIAPLNLHLGSREIRDILGGIVGATATQCLVASTLNNTGGKYAATSYNLS